MEYEEISELFSEAKQADSLNVKPNAAYEGVQTMQQCPAYDISKSTQMQQCPAYDVISKSTQMQQCPAYDVMSKSTQKDQTERHKTSESGSGDN